MKDKILVVTGGSGALGRAVVNAALDAGAFVAIPGRESAEKLPPRDRLLILGGIDLADFPATKQAFEKVAAHFGRIDALANIAGGFQWQKLADADLAVWSDMFRINLLTAATATKAALPFLRDFARRNRQRGLRPGEKGRGGNGRLCGVEGRRVAADRERRGRRKG